MSDRPDDVSTLQGHYDSLARTKPHDPELLKIENKIHQLCLKTRSKDFSISSEWDIAAADDALRQPTQRGFNPIDQEIDYLRRAAMYYRDAGKEPQARAVWLRMLRDGKHGTYVSDDLNDARLGLSGKKLPEEQDN